jgi:xylose isomerase
MLPGAGLLRPVVRAALLLRWRSGSLIESAGLIGQRGCGGLLAGDQRKQRGHLSQFLVLTLASPAAREVSPDSVHLIPPQPAEDVDREQDLDVPAI